jgi:ligand-binding SRPBCC domain-containing protein
MNWVTEITHVSKNNYFIDEQRFGPYKFWHHKHFLREVDGGVEMTDIVHYKAPLGFIGKAVNHIFIRKKLASIFDYRFKKIEEILG